MSKMDLLKRKLAPVLPEAWSVIDAEAARVLKLNLAGRKIVDVRGPFGWSFAAVNTGRLDILPEQSDPDINIGVRRVQPLIEVRIPIKLPIMELDIIARGAVDPDLTPVRIAAEKIARAEDDALFGGFAKAGITGILGASPHRPVPAPKDLAEMPRAILAARETLRHAGVDGPYTLLLGTELYQQVFAATDDGHPIARRIEQLLVDRPIVHAPSLDGALLVSVRGGDYELTLGQDLSVGYAYHDKHTVELYLTESFTFRVLEPAAAVRLSR